MKTFRTLASAVALTFCLIDLVASLSLGFSTAIGLPSVSGFKPPDANPASSDEDRRGFARPLRSAGTIHVAVAARGGVAGVFALRESFFGRPPSTLSCAGGCDPAIDPEALLTSGNELF